MVNLFSVKVHNYTKNLVFLSSRITSIIIKIFLQENHEKRNDISFKNVMRFMIETLVT